MIARMAGVVALSLSLVLTSSAQDKKSDAALHASLRDVINVGADLFNLQADYAGCYRLYQGSLIAIKPMLKADQQAAIDKALADAAQKPASAERAHHLRIAIDTLRNQLGPTIPLPPVLKGPAAKKDAELIQTPPKKVGG